MKESFGNIKARLERLRGKLSEKSLDAALIAKKENIFYLSGFTGSSAYLAIALNDAALITDFRYLEQASEQAPLFKTVQCRGDMVSAVVETLKSMGAVNAGFEESHMAYSRYREFIDGFGYEKLVPLGGAVENLRIVKDREEIEMIRKAAGIADRTFKYILNYIKPGAGEIEIASEIEYFMRKEGASGASFETIAASGKRSAMPHAVASEKRLECGDAVVLDFGAIYNGYCSDITRTVFLGEPDSELKKIYSIVLESQARALEAARSGLTGKEVDAVARDIIIKAGYGENFGHGLGHGVGLEVHEEPRLSPAGNVRLEDGMVATVEPGVYAKGLGGVRIEDMIVFCGDKPVVLTQAPKEMIIL